ncbi:ashwin-like isoform X1 [Paramuricea clavata]|uniref:Ashwin n=1 Tax=Paramuricea clavata TaxID=317549 RepID=A0A7D9EED7_PARCT|nr:ashwin-like isoform X1 [Paramuricea clavata]
MADNSSSILSHPEILSVEKLKDILSCRGIPDKAIVDKDKNGLVQLFHRFIVPLPQRTTRNTRRANRLKIKRVTSPAGAREYSCRGIKRKSNSSDTDQTVPTKEDCNISHDKQSSISPTTECANKIISLRMNCQMSKPLKLNRDCLLHDPKQNNSVTKSKIVNYARQSKVSETTKRECSKVSDSSQKVSLCCFHF